MSDDVNYTLVRGSIYRVISAGSTEQAIETEGEFLGYQQFGEESALAIRTDKNGKTGNVRIIPCSAVLYVDVIKQEKEVRKVRAREEKVEFYG